MLNLQSENAVESKGRSASQLHEDARDTGVGSRFGEQAQGAAEARRDRAQSAAVERAKKMDASPESARKEAPTANEMLTGKIAAARPAPTPPPQASSPLSSATTSAPSGTPAAPSTVPPVPPSAPAAGATAPAAELSAPRSSTPSAPAPAPPAPATAAPTPAPAPAPVTAAPAPAPAPAAVAPSPAPPAPATAQSAPAPARQPQLSERSVALGLSRATDRLQARLTVADRSAAESTVRDLVTRAGGSI